MLVEQAAHWGGRALVDDVTIDGMTGHDWVAERLVALDAMPNVDHRARTTAVGVYDHGYVLAEERLRGDGPRRRLWRIRAARGSCWRPARSSGRSPSPATTAPG